MLGFLDLILSLVSSIRLVRTIRLTSVWRPIQRLDLRINMVALRALDQSFLLDKHVYQITLEIFSVTVILSVHRLHSDSLCRNRLPISCQMPLSASRASQAPKHHLVLLHGRLQLQCFNRLDIQPERQHVPTCVLVLFIDDSQRTILRNIIILLKLLLGRLRRRRQLDLRLDPLLLLVLRLMMMEMSQLVLIWLLERFILLPRVLRCTRGRLGSFRAVLC